MKNIVLMSVFFLIQSAYAVSISDQKNLAALIEKTILEKQKVENSGVAISIFNKNEIVFQKGFGYKNREEKLPVTNHTAFAIGSTTKAFTSLGIKLLENEGLLKITDKVNDHLYDFKLSNSNITKQATIEDLLTHRVGLPRHDLLWLFSNFSREENYRRMAFLSFPGKAEENFRKKFTYNNFLFMVAGKIIEEKTHQSYENFIQERIFDKLSMKETFPTVPVDYSDVATPYYQETRIPHWDISDMAPAGSIYSTTTDMTKWIQSWMKNSWSGQEDILRARIGMDEEKPDLKYGYGLGWMNNTLNPQFSWQFHDGAIPGFSTIVLFSRELDLGIVILVNQDSSALGGNLLTELLKYEIAKRPMNKNFDSKKSIRLSQVDQSFMLPKNLSFDIMNTSDVKTYEDAGYGVLETLKKDGKSYVNYYGNVWEIKPIDHQYFNYIADMVLGGDHYEFPFKIEEEKVSVPFENGVPLIEFARIQ